MRFHSLEYGLFLVLAFFVFWALARVGMFRVLFLLVASWVFYAAWNPYFLLLIAASTLTDYFVGLRMDAAGDDKARKKPWLIVSLVMNLGLLAVFKYSDFFYESVVGVANLAGASLVWDPLEIVLPAGISFYTFQTLSYSIDVYRGRLAPERSFMKFAFFVGYFPQLIAGPIVRAADFLPQIGKTPYFSRQQASRAMWLIGLGLMKKVLIADMLGGDIVDRVFEDPEKFSSLDMMLGLYAYTMQIYMDFSAYTDLAIGSALLFGFKLPDNFDRPYIATSVQDFWRRWHKTLGSWLRDYLYYPLGGGQVVAWKVYRNLFITFLLIGLWHGADWAFVVYGSLHAAAMCINRYLRKRRERLGITLNPTLWGKVWRIALTLHFVVFARILFRSGAMRIQENIHLDSFGKSGDVLSVLGDGTWLTASVMTPLLWVVLIGSFVWHWTPRRWTEATFLAYRRMPLLMQGFLLAAVVLTIGAVTDGRPQSFAYEKF
ncbi:MAG: alginate O-acetyltransferase complex protein AlgI [Myxococcota bacterium]